MIAKEVDYQWHYDEFVRRHGSDRSLRMPRYCNGACICRREFLDIEDITEAREVVDLYNSLYHNEHEFEQSNPVWTGNGKLAWRKEYAPPILMKIRNKLDDIVADPNLPPDCALRDAVA